MTPEAQRIAIAEACGWKFVVNPVTHIGGYWETGEQGRAGYQRGDWGSRDLVVGVPDYLNDLNAIHEAEKVMDNDPRLSAKYWLTLYDITDGTGERDELTGHWLNLKLVGSATAAQRAEAFLRTLGLWKESLL